MEAEEDENRHMVQHQRMLRHQARLEGQVRLLTRKYLKIMESGDIDAI
jgi:hypothetical protein